MTADFEERYDIISAAAWILGHARNTGIPVLPVTIRLKKAFECSAEELERIIDEGLAARLKLYPFKKTHSCCIGPGGYWDFCIRFLSGTFWMSEAEEADVKHLFTSSGKKVFTLHGKEFFTFPES